MDYRKCASEILTEIGGKENLVSAAHCATRLRLVIADNAKASKERLEEIDGVRGVFEAAGQLQIIIGTGTVNKVYDEFIDLAGVAAASKDDVKQAAAAKQPMWKRAIKTVGDVFVPILPAIVASGLLMGIVEALGKIESLHFEGTAWYQFLDMMSATAFAFLPVIVAISAAKVFGANIYLGAVLGLMMVHPSLLNGWNVGSEDAIMSMFGTTSIPTWNLFGNIKVGGYVLGSISRHGYQGHVIPIVIAVWVLAKIEKWLHKKVPEMLDLFVVPITSIFLTSLVTFMAIGPVFSLLENYVLDGAKFLITNPFGAIVIGALYPVTVVMGLHHMYNGIESGMLAQAGGFNTWMPVATAANFAQAGSSLAVGIKSKNAKTKSVAIPAALSASLGITEPAIFGINLRYMKPFVCAMIGAAVGGGFAAFAGLKATAYGVTGFPGFLIITNIPLYALLLLISGGVAFILTLILWNEEKKDEPKKEPVKKEETKKVEEVVKAETDSDTVYAPCNGEVIPLDQVPDETFASGALGNGCGIVPVEGVVKAPFNGTVTMVFDTGHAIGLMSDDGIEILIHVGINTVELGGNHYEKLVADGDKVAVGTPLLKFDMEAIKAAGYDITTPVIVTNTDDFKTVGAPEVGKKAAGSALYKVTR